MVAAAPAFGNLLREWRQRRRLSQLELACEAEISTRHLSFVETGRSTPSREMVLRLADQLAIPMRERNVLLVAAGYAPVYSERLLSDPALDAARKAIDLFLEAHKPYPAFAIDRHWNIVASNRALPGLYVGVADFLLQPPINGLRLTLHPQGLAQRIVNLVEWREHLFARLRRQIQITADPVLAELLRELSDYACAQSKPVEPRKQGEIIPQAQESAVGVPFRIITSAGELSFFSMTTVFGTPVDVTLAELALEFFFPLDDVTVERVGQL
jgi:transcriptional regulator with XRE-family HTH domain